jgi:NAD(P)-dependent dehydrogenase (short-subunit alcohol dehydrogenase family)
MRFENKVALVTASAGAGIGQTTARAFAKEGARVVVSDGHAQRLEKVAQEMRSSLSAPILPIKCDVTDRQEVDNMITQAIQEFGQIDILVNNAGFDMRSSVVDMTDEAWERIVNINLRGTFYCCRAVLPHMLKRGYGKIINLSSIAAWQHTAEDSAVYGACKAGIIGFTKLLAREVAPKGINVNAVAPGFTANDYNLRAGLERLESYRKLTPIGRFGKPEDQASAILFLASDAASFIVGATLCVSGGWYMH